MQGDYDLFQSSSPSRVTRRRTYDNYEVVREMVLSEGWKIQENGVLSSPECGAVHMTIPSNFVLVYPEDGQLMTMNLRCDDTFVQDDGWYGAAHRYRDFLQRHEGKRVLYLELGVGDNTPVLTASFAKHRKSTENDTVRPSYGYFMKEIGGGYNTMKVRAE